MTAAKKHPANPDEDYLTEEDDLDLEDENDLREIRVGDDTYEPDPEDEDIHNEPLFDDQDEDQQDDNDE